MNFSRKTAVFKILSIQAAAFFILALLPALAFAQETQKIKFSYSPNTAAKSVFVAGTFNDWSKDAAPMKETQGGVWETEMDIAAGSHFYKFVINGNVWVSDPSNPETSDDGQGGKNSVLYVGKNVFERISKVSPKDELIEIEGLQHKPNEVKYLDFTAKDRVRIMLRTFKNDLKKAVLLTAGGRVKKFAGVNMKKYATDDIYDYYKAYFPNSDSQCVYLFELSSGGKTSYYGYKGLFEPSSGNGLSKNAIKVPDYFFLNVNNVCWWPDAIFYQIFPDRFYDGDPKLNQKFVMPWESEPSFDNFMGGDIAGITQKLDYLKELGVNAIYLNPIFKSFSNHKYDAVDYFEIDPTLGDLTCFDTFVKSSHEKGFKLILDGVFNHTSTDFFAFADVKKNGAGSKYSSWYNFKSFPLDMQKPNYDCWWNIGSMPKLNIKNHDVYDYLLSVPGYWMNRGIDGFRLDVPNELPHAFWKDFRKTVKQRNSSAYIVGEIWSDGAKWLAGDQFDSIMNYKLRNFLISFFVKNEMKPSELNSKLSSDKINISEAAFFSLFNLAGSHDTPRILSVCNGDIKKVENIIAFIMAYPGSPCIYYGDEIGLTGEKDPANRKCMQWNEAKWNKDIHNFYKKIIGIRNENIELRRGDIFTLEASDEDRFIAFVRPYGNSAVICSYNLSKKDISRSYKPQNIYSFLSYSQDAPEKLQKIKVSNLMEGETKDLEKSDIKEIETITRAETFSIYKISFDESKK